MVRRISFEIGVHANAGKSSVKAYVPEGDIRIDLSEPVFDLDKLIAAANKDAERTSSMIDPKKAETANVHGFSLNCFRIHAEKGIGRSIEEKLIIMEELLTKLNLATDIVFVCGRDTTLPLIAEEVVDRFRLADTRLEIAYNGKEANLKGHTDARAWLRTSLSEPLSGKEKYQVSWNSEKGNPSWREHPSMTSAIREFARDLCEKYESSIGCDTELVSRVIATGTTLGKSKDDWHGNLVHHHRISLSNGMGFAVADTGIAELVIDECESRGLSVVQADRVVPGWNGPITLKSDGTSTERKLYKRFSFSHAVQKPVDATGIGYLRANMTGYANTKAGRMAMVECGGKEFVLRDNAKEAGMFGSPHSYTSESGVMSGTAFVRVQVRDGKIYGLSGSTKKQAFNTPLDADPRHVTTKEKAEIAIAMEEPRIATHWSALDVMDLTGADYPETIENAEKMIEMLESETKHFRDSTIEHGNMYLSDALEAGNAPGMEE